MKSPLSLDFFVEKGLALSTLKGFLTKESDKKQLPATNNTPVDNWDCRSIPSKVFSSESTEEIRQRRIFAAILIGNYAALRKSSRLVSAFKRRKITGETRLLETLTVYYNSYVLTLENSPCLADGAALSFNSSVNLIKSFNEGLVILDTCPCGKPLLIRVQDIYTYNMAVRRDFFRCPWCNRMDKALKVYLERKIYASSQWQKFINQASPPPFSEPDPP